VQLFLMNGRLSGIEQNVSGIKASVGEIRLAQASTNPTSSSNIQEAKQVLEEAKKAKVKISQRVIEETGKRFMEVSQDNPEAWDASLAFLDYRTFLNADFAPKLSKPTPITLNSKVGDYIFELGLKQNPGTERVGKLLSVSVISVGQATPEESARLELLSHPQPQGSGIAKIVVMGRTDGIILDGQYLKNVTVINADVYYQGGPLRLANVVFINCRFHFANQQPSRDLGQSILTASSVNFSQIAG